MPVSIECPNCDAVLRVSEKQVGKKGKCPRCSTVFPLTETVLEVAKLPGGMVESRPAAPAQKPVPKVAPAAPAPAAMAPLQPMKTRVEEEDEDDSPYELAGASTKKAKTVKVREGALPSMGVNAKGVAEAAAPTRRTLTPAQILSAFDEEIEPVRPSVMYRVWIVLVAFIMLLLPIVYACLVALVIAGLVYHAVHDIAIFQMAGNGRGAFKVALVLYVTPLVVGAVVVGFMLKPFFAKPAKRQKQRELDPSNEPLLFAFVDGVCTTVNAPRPARIAVDCQVNASAHREGGFLGLIGGDLVLTVGLPLAAGLDLKQFAGVLAHEFGHFAQGAGMRLSMLIWKVNRWFARVVYERDEWDQTLENWVQSGEIWIKLLGLVAKLAVWLTRRVLWVLMMVGHMASSFLSRQMEYDADRYKARMIGAEAFAGAMRRVQVLSLAENGAYADLRTSWQQQRLPDNFPKLVVANVPQIPPPMLEAFEESMENARTGLFDTHPALKDRIANAEAEAPEGGIFDLKGPATELFRDFDGAAKQATYAFYRTMLGPQIKEDQLFAVAELVESQAVTMEGFSAANRFFLGALNATRALPLPASYPSAPENAARAKQALEQARATLQAQREKAREADKQEDNARAACVQAETAWTLLKAGCSISARQYGLEKATLPAAEAAKAKTEAALKALDEAYAPFSMASARRMALALGILELEAVRKRVPDAEDRREEAQSVFPCAALIGRSLNPELAALIRAQQVLVSLIQMFQSRGQAKAQELVNPMLRAGEALRVAIEALRWKIPPSAEYPFEHAQYDITLARYVLPAVTPDKENLSALLDASGEAIERVVGLFQRSLGRLAVTAEEVEKALGLPAIEFEEDQPEEDEEESDEE